MKILIIGANGKKGYSGGRYHAWILAQSLIKSGNEVDFWTNNVPFFSRDFASNDLQCRVSIDLSLDYKVYKSGNYNVVLLIPDHSPLSGIYEKAILSAKISNSKLVLLNFETPNWFNSMSKVPRPEYFWEGWNYVARHASMILSSNSESMGYARKYFTNTKAVHEYAYPAINASVQSKLNTSARKRQAVVITRFDKKSLHKGGAEIVKFFCQRFEDYNFIFVGLKDIKIISELRELARKFNISINTVNNISDKEKFKILAESELSIFLSEFEGFGYPPIESLSVGTPCVVRPLPVIKETCGDYATYLPSCPNQIMMEGVDVIPISQDIAAEFKEKYSFQKYGDKVEGHLIGADRVAIGNFDIAVCLTRLLVTIFYGGFRFLRGMIN